MRIRSIVQIGAFGLFSVFSASVCAAEKGAKPSQESPPQPTFGAPICAAQCVADIIADGFVNIDDLLAIVNGWGMCVSCPPYCAGDANHDCATNIDDLLVVINGWGPCPAPANDNCANATLLSLPIPSPIAVDFCTANATTDGAALPGCNFCCNDTQVHKDIWYRFNPSGGGYTIMVDTCSADFDTKIAIYRAPIGLPCACPGLPNGAILVTCNDDDPLNTCNLRSRVHFDTVGSSCYFIRVGGYSGASGSGTMTVRILSQGDECFNAIDLGVVGPTTPTGAITSTQFFTPGYSVLQAPCTSFFDGPDVWYKFQIGCGGNVIGSVNTCDGSSDFDTILTLYRGTCDGGLILVGCNDDYLGNPNCQVNGLFRKSLVDLPNAASAGYYYVRVSGYNGSSGWYSLRVGLSCIN